MRTSSRTCWSWKVVDKTYNAGVRVETATVDRRDATYLLRDGSDFVFMDSEDFEQHPLPESLVGTAANFLLENMPVQIAFNEGAPLYLELPVTVEVLVASTSPACRATAPTPAPSRPPWRPARRSRCRCSSTPATSSRWTPATAAM